jgi:ribulose-phosphate 3-epimerase
LNDPVKLSASVACIDPLRYREVVEELQASHIDALHFDICDGHFAHTFLLFPGLVESLRPLSTSRFDIHLYCTHPSRYLDEFARCGADLLVVPVEAEEDYRKLIHAIAERGMKPGLGILPATKIPEDIAETLPHLHMVVINTVGPAYAGQPFDLRGLDNLKQLNTLINMHNLNLELAVDGNVCVERLDDLLGGGASHLVCGTSSVLRSGTQPGEALGEFRRVLVKRIGGISRPDPPSS